MADTNLVGATGVLEKPYEIGKIPEETARIHVAIPKLLKAQLEALRRNTGKGSMSDLFRAAIMLYQLAYKEHQKGSDLLIRNKNGEIERLKLFF